jgi:hypothetical protein
MSLCCYSHTEQNFFRVTIPHSRFLDIPRQYLISDWQSSHMTKTFIPTPLTLQLSESMLIDKTTLNLFIRFVCIPLTNKYRHFMIDESFIRKCDIWTHSCIQLAKYNVKNKFRFSPLEAFFFFKLYLNLSYFIYF